MKVFVTFLLLVAVSHLTKSQSCSSEEVEIICSSVKNANWGAIKSYLTCRGDYHDSIKSTFPDSSVSSVVHSNRSEVTNLGYIKGLSINSATVKFIPFGIKEHFLNLKALQISSCGLLSVNKENLKQFGTSLENLALHGNKIISIDADLFEYNPNLKGIWLNGNPTRHIEPEFFTNLKTLKNIELVSLESTNCMSQYFHTANGHNIMTFKWNYEKCNDNSAKVETENLNRNDFRCLRQKIADSTSEIMDNIEKSTSISIQNSESTNKSIMELENKLEALTSAQDSKTKTLIEETNENIDRHGALLVTLSNESRDEIIENNIMSASNFTVHIGLVNESIKALGSELKTSTIALQNEHKIMIENHSASMKKLDCSLNNLGNRSSKDFDNLKILIQDNKDLITTKLAASDDQINGMKDKIDMLEKLTLALTDAINQQNKRVGDLMEHLERNMNV